jgi:hypothetical protein
LVGLDGRNRPSQFSAGRNGEDDERYGNSQKTIVPQYFSTDPIHWIRSCQNSRENSGALIHNLNVVQATQSSLEAEELRFLMGVGLKKKTDPNRNSFPSGVSRWGETNSVD